MQIDARQNLANPLLVQSQHSTRPGFVNYDEDEDTTCINELTYLKFNKFRAYFVVPILVVFSGLLFGLFLFWYQSLRIYWFYDEVGSLREATHMKVLGRLQTTDIVELYSLNPSEKEVSVFRFRFIQFEFNNQTNKFEPVVFHIKDSHQQIINQYAMGLNPAQVINARQRYGDC